MPCNFVVPEIGTMKGFFAKSQAKAACADVAFYLSQWKQQNQLMLELSRLLKKLLDTAR
jgi:hypothetical protein